MYKHTHIFIYSGVFPFYHEYLFLVYGGARTTKYSRTWYGLDALMFIDIDVSINVRWMYILTIQNQIIYAYPSTETKTDAYIYIYI